MRKLIFAALIGAAALPATGIAQTRELWRDRQDIHQERRDLDRAYRSGDRHDIREAREDYREARREYHEDRRDYARNRDHHFYRGGRIDQSYYQPRYHMNDYARYRLPRPGWNQRWIRHRNDLLLIDVRNGYVIDVRRGQYR
jgi:Ni/Co efflux regulator RcnB